MDAINAVLGKLITTGMITKLNARDAILAAIEEVEDRLGTLKMWRDGTLVPNGFGEVTPSDELRAAQSISARAVERVRVMFNGATPPKGTLIEFNQAVAKAKDRTDKADRIIRVLTPKVIASRKLQGQYIAALRQVPKTQRAKFQVIARKLGRDVAIGEMKRKAGRKS